jgi:FkbM family methyltransferase
MLAFDCGMNNGDDAAYYLFKGYKVVAIEADARLCEDANQRFANEIASGRLTILNLAIGKASGIVEFSIHTQHSVLSTLEARSGEGWLTVSVRQQPLSQVIDEHGMPDLLKIDIEGHDLAALRDIKKLGYRPAAISAEAHEHGIEVVQELISWGYQRFKLMPCMQIGIASELSEIPVRKLDGTVSPFSFHPHSSGPFGDDAPMPWLSATEIEAAWESRDPNGWYDVQAAG